MKSTNLTALQFAAALQINEFGYVKLTAVNMHTAGSLIYRRLVYVSQSKGEVILILTKQGRNLLEKYSSFSPRELDTVSPGVQEIIHRSGLRKVS